MKPTMLNLICARVSLIVLVLMFTGQSDAKVKETLVGAWLFDGNAKDSSENSKDGKLENGPTFVAGKIGQALKFSGGKAGDDKIGNRVNLGDLGLEPTGAATFVFWVNPDGAKPDDRLISNMVGAATPSFSIRFAPPKVEFWGSSWQPVIEKFDDKQWGHYAVTLDGKANVTGYYNGKKGLTLANHTYAIPPTLSLGATFLLIWGQHYKGLMDDVAFFNVMLTAADIKSVMNKGLKTSLAVSSTGKLTTSWGGLITQYQYHFAILGCPPISKWLNPLVSGEDLRHFGSVYLRESLIGFHMRLVRLAIIAWTCSGS